MVLLLVLSVLTISYASSLKAYFQQHSQIQQLRAQIASSEASIHELESEKQRWQTRPTSSEQARARFGYLMPGQTSYVVIGADGKPLSAAGDAERPAHDHYVHAHGLVDRRVEVRGAGRQPAGGDVEGLEREVNLRAVLQGRVVELEVRAGHQVVVNFSAYSMTLTPRKTPPSTIVRTSQSPAALLAASAPRAPPAPSSASC